MNWPCLPQISVQSAISVRTTQLRLTFVLRGHTETAKKLNLWFNVSPVFLENTVLKKQSTQLIAQVRIIVLVGPLLLILTVQAENTATQIPIGRATTVPLTTTVLVTLPRPLPVWMAKYVLPIQSTTQRVDEANILNSITALATMSASTVLLGPTVPLQMDLLVQAALLATTATVLLLSSILK